MEDTARLLLEIHPKGVVEGVSIMALGGQKCQKEFKRLIQKSLGTEKMGLLH
uniref:Uncharacterized protein n=1 Tax=Lepeophtheirus salmonis TaxID=72036 RepID=A0A0K2TVU9_LEPSM